MMNFDIIDNTKNKINKKMNKRSMTTYSSFNKNQKSIRHTNSFFNFRSTREVPDSKKSTNKKVNFFLTCANK